MKTATKYACMANGAVLKQPGKDAKIIKGKDLEREIAHLGLFMERYGVECLTESEICKAVIFLMDSEVTLCYDGREFTAFELF